MPVAHDVVAHATLPRTAGRVALRVDDRTRTYATLAADALAGADDLRSRDTRPGDLVALSLADPFDLVTAALSVDLLGATALVCDPVWSVDHRRDVLRALAPAVVVEVGLPRAAPLPAAPTTAPSDRCRPSPPDTSRFPAAGPDDRPWAGFSSGSTGRPRAVVRSRASWTGSYDATTALTGTRPGDVVLVPGPLASSLYFFAAAHALALGATVRFARPGAQLATALGASDVVHVVPTVAEEVVSALESGTPSRVRTLVVGGASLPPRLRERAAEREVGVFAYYGAVELSFVASDADGSGLRAFPGVEIDVRPVPGARLGEVWVRSPWTALGYLADATGPYVREDGWCTVGDLAEPTVPAAATAPPVPDTGVPDTTPAPLVLRGRGDGAVLTGGATVVPEDVEVVLRPVPGVRDVVVVGTPHRRLGAVVTAVVECDDRPGLRAHLERVARATLAPAQRPRRWYRAGRLPRTPSGKPARGRVSELLLDGSRELEPLR